jgi:hypothetical protein
MGNNSDKKRRKIIMPALSLFSLFIFSGEIISFSRPAQFTYMATVSYYQFAILNSPTPLKKRFNFSGKFAFQFWASFSE